MKVTFLGTGTSSGVPLIGCTCAVCRSPHPKDKRLRASVWLEFEGRYNLLIDAGPDFRQQMLTYGISHMEGILLTHSHKDHVGGLDEVRAFNFLGQPAVPLYGEARVLQALHQEYSYAFVDAAHRYPGAPKMELCEIDLHPFTPKGFEAVGIEVVPVRALHGALPLLGFRIGPFGYLTDANSITAEELSKFHGVEVFVVSTVQHPPHKSHFSLDQAIAVAQQVGAPTAYLTHLSHLLEPHNQLEAMLPPGIKVAYDGLQLLL